jgi:hypothetical protein
METAEDFSWLNVTVKKEDFAPFRGQDYVNVRLDNNQLLMIGR